ncbi:MAG TPA: UDP-2,3-diacylglucosamine diphosphatase [Cellvibrionaceae bacterium]
MSLLFISDLHLHPSRPEATAGFYRFLQEQARTADALYILGDFFDSWIGDDDDEPLGIEVAEHLHALSKTGVAIFLMHGNRDFLLGEDFARRAGVTLIADPVVININGRQALLLHGDSLCTRDSAYMAMREQFRNRAWQAQILAQPLAVRRALAEQLRQQSKTMNSMKADDIMDVTPEAVVQMLEQHQVDLMIHGHTHRPETHEITAGGKSCQRIVLGDWHEYGWCLRADNSGLLLESWLL